MYIQWRKTCIIFGLHSNIYNEIFLSFYFTLFLTYTHTFFWHIHIYSIHMHVYMYLFIHKRNVCSLHAEYNMFIVTPIISQCKRSYNHKKWGLAIVKSLCATEWDLLLRHLVDNCRVSIPISRKKRDRRKKWFTKL